MEKVTELKEKVKIKRIVIPIVIVVILCVVAFNAFVVVDAGHTGVVVTMGKVNEGVLQEGTPEQRAVFDQTLDILSRAITEERQLYTARLHPQGLGEIIVRMEKSSAGVVFDILATNEKTAAMINSRLVQLQDGLTEYDAKINPAVVTSASNAESTSGFELDDYSGGYNGQQENAYSGNRNRAENLYEEAGEDENIARTTGYRSSDLLNRTI